ncbi:MAG TPA: energy-coupling factor ABC transporter permease [Candidatus Limnocylindrales bacterium]|nr:energy-coupling factor ABC transporter permease [Candidatus Limnocylindrales bacterium]
MDLFAIAAAPVTSGIEPSLHAADRFLTVPVSLLMWTIVIVVIAIAVRQTNRTMDERSVPLMGVMAAFIFAAQMFNFQVAGGTSGHLLGGVLAAILLGPWAGTLVMACVIAVQGLVFSDGGLVVMGANIFNMGVVGTLGGFAIYLALCRVLGGEDRARIPASAVAAWLAVVMASVAMSLELIVSGTSPAEIVLPAMLGVHVFIGIGEALITAAALAFIAATRKDLLDLRPDRAAALAARTAASGATGGGDGTGTPVPAGA